MNNETQNTIIELARQNAVLKTFVRTIIKENCFGYDGEVDGMDVQDQAANCGIILPETVTREMVEEWERTQTRPDDFDEGDTIYNFAPWMTGDAEQMPIPSCAEVAREFMHEIGARMENQTYSELVKNMGSVLQEWEDAENKP